MTSFKHLVRTAVTVIAQGSELKMNINRSLCFKTWGFGKVNSSELITDYSLCNFDGTIKQNIEFIFALSYNCSNTISGISLLKYLMWETYTLREGDWIIWGGVSDGTFPSEEEYFF